MPEPTEAELRRAAEILRNRTKDDIEPEEIELVSMQLPILTADMMRQTDKLIQSFEQLVEDDEENDVFLADPIGYLNQPLSETLEANEIAPGIALSAEGLIEAYRKARELKQAGHLDWNEVAGVHSRVERKTYANIIEKKSALIDTKRERAIHTERNRHTVTSTSDRFMGVSTPLIDPAITISIHRWEGENE